MQKVRLTQNVTAGGWAGKVGPADLKQILSDLHKSRDPRVIIGLGDDAGVCLFKGGAIVETVDVITPIVDDPYTFGAISDRQLVLPKAAQGRNQISESGGSRALSAFSFQLSASEQTP